MSSNGVPLHTTRFPALIIRDTYYLELTRLASDTRSDEAIVGSDVPMFGAARGQPLVDAPSSWVTEVLEHHNRRCAGAARFKLTPQLLVFLCGAALSHFPFLSAPLRCGMTLFLITGLLRVAVCLVASPRNYPGSLTLLHDLRYTCKHQNGTSSKTATLACCQHHHSTAVVTSGKQAELLLASFSFVILG